MKITIIAVGKLKASHPFFPAYQHYQKLLPWQLTIKEIDERNKAREEEKFLDSIPRDALVVACDEKGKQYSSKAFAATIEEWGMQAISHLAFAIGAADGLPRAVRDKSTLLLSMGQFTWPHMAARVMLLEQLYRAYTITTGHPYHRE